MTTTTLKPTPEDETFRRLKREPDWNLVRDTVFRKQNEAAHEARVKALEELGWTMDEFDNGLIKAQAESNRISDAIHAHSLKAIEKRIKALNK